MYEVPLSGLGAVLGADPHTLIGWLAHVEV